MENRQNIFRCGDGEQSKYFQGGDSKIFSGSDGDGYQSNESIIAQDQ